MGNARFSTTHHEERINGVLARLAGGDLGLVKRAFENTPGDPPNLGDVMRYIVRERANG